MSIQRWDPLRDIVTLREAMNNLLEESFVRPRAGMIAMTGGMAIDLRESDQSYIVEAVVAGAKPEDVEISVLGETLRIAVEIRDEADQHGDNEKWLLRERRYGRYERSLTLPAQVKADEATADFQDGILTISLPKAEAARPRSIPVRGATAGQERAEPQEIDVMSEPGE